MLEQAAWIAGIIAAIAAILALCKSVTRKSVQTNSQDATIKGNSNSVNQNSNNTLDKN